MIAKKAPNPIDKHVGSRVRMRRMMLSMSQEKLGDALSLTFQQVQKYEKGTNRIGASRLQQIAHILQVPVSFFFEGAPHSGHGTGMGEAPSPAMTILLVVVRVSQPSRVFTRLSSAMPSLMSFSRNASSTASEIWSQTLSGWPSETDSLVKRKFV